MRSQKLSCITPIGLVTALITGLAIAITGIARGGAMFSPGPLNAITGPALGGVNAHADLESRCSACHTAPWDAASIADRCLACHYQVTEEMADPGTLHGALIHNDQEAYCLHCHTEHHGPQAALTQLDTQNFPHDATGYSLTGHAHHPDGAEFTCQDCHDGRYSQTNTSNCIDCHSRLDAGYMSAHTAVFGSACLECHDGVDRFGKNFDHNQTGFALTGAHEPLDCASCHLGQESPEALAGTSQECTTCHQQNDAHNGALGADCAACHSPESWTAVRFDHDSSTFPLTGAHIAVTCAECHVDRVYKDTPTACAACHAGDDHHNGQFGSDCALCHTPSRWQKIIFDHAQSRFPLTGAHASLPCLRCHEQVFRGTPAECSACHTEPALHAGLFLGDCGSCHTTETWQPASFNGPHPFPMSHGEATGCRDCHTTDLASSSCYTCHEQGEIFQEHQEEGITDLGNCLSCHPTGQEDEAKGSGESGDGDDD